MKSIEKVDKYIYSIDQYFMEQAKISSCYLIEGEKIALYDAYPAAVSGRILNGIEDIGYKPEDISALFLQSYSYGSCSRSRYSLS